MKITSPAFNQGGHIPAQYTCDGEDYNPPLHIEGIPDGTVTLALIVEDPDAPNGIYDHWIVWNIDPVHEIKGGGRPGISGKNSAGKTGYHGPCPPSGKHHYYFYIFALDMALDLPTTAHKQDLQEAMEGHIIGQGSIMGTYEKK